MTDRAGRRRPGTLLTIVIALAIVLSGAVLAIAVIRHPVPGRTRASSPGRGGPGGRGGHRHPLPPGARLQPIDGGSNYFSKWKNSFPGSPRFMPIGVFPAESRPASLAAEGINFFTPMRSDATGAWCPVWRSSTGNDMGAVYAQRDFYSGGTFYRTSGRRAWGARAAFDVFGDELDGNGNNWFDCLPRNITQARRAGSWGGLSAGAYEAAESASHKDDPSRPTYIQTTVTFMDGDVNRYYTMSQKRAICQDADIFSFDAYPLDKRQGNVWDAYREIMEARAYCDFSRPVFFFTEMDHMDGGTVYPLPAQTVAEVWDAIIGGAAGVQYFDQYGHIDDRSYTGNGRYPKGAMYAAIKNTDSEVSALAPVLKSDFVQGYVTAPKSLLAMTKYEDGHFYVFAAPAVKGPLTATFTLAGHENATVKLIYDSASRVYSSSGGIAHVYRLTRPETTVDARTGRFSTVFRDSNEVKIYEITQ